MKIGYFLSSEERGPKGLIAQAVRAKEAGFEGLWISDHFHPWEDAQGHSPFVWATIGGIAQAAPGMLRCLPAGAGEVAVSIWRAAPRIR